MKGRGGRGAEARAGADKFRVWRLTNAGLEIDKFGVCKLTNSGAEIDDFRFLSNYISSDQMSGALTVRSGAR